MPIDRVPLRAGCRDQTPLDGPRLSDAIDAGQLVTVPATVELCAEGVRVSDGQVIDCDRIVFATGFRYNTAWLSDVLSLDDVGVPRHHRGISLDLGQVGFVGLACQRTRRSGFLRGFSDDAAEVIRSLPS